MRRVLTLVAVAVCGLAAAALVGASANVPGELDPAFGTGGIVITQTPPNGQIYDLAIQPDGKIVAAGVVGSRFESDFEIVRYQPDGSLDPTFGSAGRVILSFGTSNDVGQEVALQPDGKIVVVGFADMGTGGIPDFDFALARLLANGSLDPSFGTGGKVTTDVGGAHAVDAGRALVLQPDGKIVAVGESYKDGSFDAAAARYTATGALDGTFGSGGTVVTPTGPGADLLTDVILQPDGKLVATGPIQGEGTSYDPGVIRYLPNGSLDATFGSGGLAIVASGATVLRYSHVVLQPDGKLVVSGAFSNGTDRDFGAARLTLAGALDTTFGMGGKSLTPIGPGNETAGDLALQGNGKIVLAGTVSVDRKDTAATFGVVRLGPSGALDTGFGTGGKVTTQVQATDTARAVTLQPDAKIVVGGWAAPSIGALENFALARYVGAKPPCVVPRVKGKQLAAARKAIVAANCRTGSVKKIRSRSRSGTVLKQSPAPGVQLENGAKVNVTVSRGR
ncbi:MAG: PASTA domain-containing protein [Actinobacteria bacterium]|nr:PASTA domain-containing protein [Actinomycetota bacterium]